MKKILKKPLIFLFSALCIASQSAFCYTLKSTDIKNAIYQETYNEIKDDVQKYSAEYKITINGVPSVDIITNEYQKPSIELSPSSNRFQPNFYKRVIIKNSKGEILKSFPVNICVQIFKEVLCASENIAFEQDINAKNTHLEKKDISKFLDKTLSSVGENTISKRNYPKNSIILKDGIKQKSVILKNSTVEILFVSQKGLNIKLQGKALKDGAIGDRILVKSDKYNKIYTAVINSANEVIVRI